MAQVKSSNGKSTEQKLVAVFRAQRFVGWRRGYPLTGKPDFVFLKPKVAVFVDGCFWHGHPVKCRIPSTNRDYWIKKIAGNVRRDKSVTRELRKQGWIVLRIWEDQVDKPGTVRRLIKVLYERKERS